MRRNTSGPDNPKFSDEIPVAKNLKIRPLCTKMASHREKGFIYLFVTKLRNFWQGYYFASRVKHRP